MEIFSGVFFLFGLGWALVLGGLSLALTLVAETNAGMTFALGGILLSIAPLLIWYSWDSGYTGRKVLVRLAVFGGLGIFAWLGLRSPDGHPPTAGARVQNRYSGGEWKYQRYALGNLLPESDQLMLGYMVIPAADRLFTMKQGRHMTKMTSAIYRELEADPDFHALGSVMPDTYNDLWGLPFTQDHYFLYIPPKLDRKKPSPVLIFLHGAGGNFKAYTWIFSKVADELGMVLIVPSDGMGDWGPKRSARIVTSALADAAKVVELDPGNTHLMGLSNGGLGLCQVGAVLGEQFRTLTFLSPVFDKPSVTSDAFLKKWQDNQVLVISGQKDDRVPFAYVSEQAARLTKAEVIVTLVPVADADHFMVFSHRELVCSTITSWLRGKIAH